jgi:predicted GNAT family acetyltransferase
MEVLRPPDARSFLELTGPLLERDEARNQLPLGIAATVADAPQAYDVVRTWVVRDGERPVAAAIRTDTYNLVLGDPTSEEALRALAAAVVRDDPDVPGAIGNLPFGATAARTLAAGTRRTAELVLSQGVFALTDVADVPKAPGGSRLAGERDRDLLLVWMTAFAREALPDAEGHERAERGLEVRLASDDAGFWFWEVDGEPVSMSSYGGRTPNGIRIGMVYTPPEHRRRGYATALVAEQSRWLLEHGYRLCFLYTDLSNPTSNAIYERIGYRRVCESVEYRFRA